MDFEQNDLKMAIRETANESKDTSGKHEEETLNANAFIKIIVAEIEKMESFIVKPEAKTIVNELKKSKTIDEARPIAHNLLKSIFCDEITYLEDERSKHIFNNAPIFNLLFLMAEPLNEFENSMKNHIYNDNSREQHVLYVMSNMSYFGSYSTAKDAIENINERLKNENFDVLDEKNDFDKLVMTCLKNEEKINEEYNVDLTIGGMRSLSLLLQ